MPYAIGLLGFQPAYLVNADNHNGNTNLNFSFFTSVKLQPDLLLIQLAEYRELILRGTDGLHVSCYAVTETALEDILL